MDSILDNTKKILGIGSSYTEFDTDIITHINAVFSTLNQLGIGPDNGYFITDKEDKWEDFADVPANEMEMIKSYIYLSVRLKFDPPTTSYLIEAMERQVKEMEWRLSIFREQRQPFSSPKFPEEEVV